MKRIILSILIAFLIILNSSLTSTAKVTEPTMITFVYLNGSNDYNFQNRLKFRDHFTKQVKKIHPKMKKGLEDDVLIQQLLLENGKYVINPEPVVFYWGDKSLIEIEKVDEGLNKAKKYTPIMAHIARSFCVHCLHDAIWVQKPQNMSTVIDELQILINTETERGHKVVLFGYSAGSFITYQYFLNKFISIKPEELIGNINNPTIENIVKTTKATPTCLAALMKQDLVRLTVDGNFYVNKDVKNFALKYPQINKQTQQSCFTVDEVKGVINFASPIILFYSNIADTSTSLNFLSQLMVKNIIENNIFFLTVNYNNDTFGFPAYENLTYNDLKNSNSVLANDLKASHGFIYNKSDIKVPRTFLSSHLSYWDTPKSFIKGITKGFNEGYKYFYGIATPKNP